MTASVAGIVLAGGLSRRMGGGDKSLKLLGERPMLQHVIERLATQVADIAINANGDPDRFAQFGLPIIADSIEGFAGPLAGVLAGLQWAATLNTIPTHIVTVATDTPFFPPDLVQRLSDVSEGHPERIVLSASGGHKHPVFGLWPLALRDDLARWMAATDTYKVLAWTALHDMVVCEFPFYRFDGRQIDPFFNANTPDELAEAETLLAGFAA